MSWSGVATDATQLSPTATKNSSIRPMSSPVRMPGVMVMWPDARYSVVVVVVPGARRRADPGRSAVMAAGTSTDSDAGANSLEARKKVAEPAAVAALVEAATNAISASTPEEAVRGTTYVVQLSIAGTEAICSGEERKRYRV